MNRATRRLGILFATVPVALLSFGSVAAAMTVNSTADNATQGNGSCSLREAIAAASAGANSADCGPAGTNPVTVSIPEGTYPLTTGQVAIPASARIVIEGANQNAPALTTIDAGGHSRVFEIAAGAVVRFNAVRIEGGQTLAGADGVSAGQYGQPGGNGGGILNFGSLTLEHVWLTRNFTGHGGRGADGDQVASGTTRDARAGGEGGSGGGIYNAEGAALSVAASEIFENGTGEGGSGGNGATGQLGIGHYPNGSEAGDGGPSGGGGGIFNAGSASIFDTTIEGNSTGRGGAGGLGGNGVGEGEMQPAGRGGYGGDGGNNGIQYDIEQGHVRYDFRGGGGGIYNAGALQISRSAIVGNHTGAGGLGGGAGIGGKELNNEYRDGALAGAGGGGGLGGGLLNYGKGATLTNVTIAENFTGDGGKGGNGPQSGSLGPGPGGYGGDGGGLWAEGADSPDYVELMQVTIATNGLGAAGPPGDDASFPGNPGQRGKGAGVAVGARHDPGGAGVYFKNTIVADNGSVPAGDENCVQYYPKEQYVDLYDLGHDMTYPGESCPGTVANPLLGPLEDNGGLTETMLPATGSPAIGLVPLASCTVHEDQRGFARPGNGTSCDAGAVETGAAPGLTTTTTALASAANPSAPGQTVKYTATISPQPSGGTVAFTDDGGPIAGCEAVALGPGGQATCAVSYPLVGSHAIEATYSGNSLFAGSSSSLTQVVQNAQETPPTPTGGGGGSAPTASSSAPPSLVPPPPKPKATRHCPKAKKRVVRKGKVRCVPKKRSHRKGKRA